MGYIIKNITKTKLSVAVGGRPVVLQAQETLIIKGNSYPISLRKLEVKKLVEVNYVADNVIALYYSEKEKNPQEEVAKPKKEIPRKAKEDVNVEYKQEPVIEEPIIEEFYESEDDDSSIITNGDTKKSTKKKTEK